MIKINNIYVIIRVIFEKNVFLFVEANLITKFTLFYISRIIFKVEIFTNTVSTFD